MEALRPLGPFSSRLDLDGEVAPARGAAIGNGDPVELREGLELDEVTLALLPDAAGQVDFEFAERVVGLLHRRWLRLISERVSSSGSSSRRDGSARVRRRSRSSRS